MVIWTGWGFLVLVIVLAASLGMELITEAVMGDDQFYQRAAWPLALALALAGVATWYVGTWLRRRGARVVIDKATGQEMTVGGSHTLFFLPMHYWGIVLLGLALAAAAFGGSAAAAAATPQQAPQQAAPGAGAEGVEGFAASLEDCKSATQEMPHPLMPNVKIKHAVTGERDGKCAYTQSMPGNMMMECALGEETRKDLAGQLRLMAKADRLTGSTKAPVMDWMNECEIVTPSGQRVPAVQGPPRKK